MKVLRLGAILLLLSILLGQGGKARPAAEAQAQAADERLRYYTAAHVGGGASRVRLLPDDYLAVAQGSELLILDTLGTFEPRLVRRVAFNGLIDDLLVQGNQAYVLSRARLYQVDLTDPAGRQPTLTLLAKGVADIDQQGAYLYLASGAVQIYSLADPAAPLLMGSYWPQSTNCDEYFCLRAGPVLEVAAAHPYLYIRTRYQGCGLWCYPPYYVNEVVDISQPTNPVKLERPAEAESFVVQETLPLDDYWLVQGASNLQPQELSALRIVAEADLLSLTPTRTLPYRAQDMAVLGDRLYLAAGEAGLQILDVADPLNAAPLGAEQTLAEVGSLVVSGSLAYITGGSQGLGVVDVRLAAAPQMVGGYRTVGAVADVLLAGDILYASSDRLDILDISDPAAPRLLGQHPQAGRLALAGQVLYLAAGEGGLVAVDVSDPGAPQELDRLVLPGTAQAAAVVGAYVYVASSEGLQVAAAADPTGLALAGTVRGFSAARIAAGLDFVALTSERALHIFDLADPQSPLPKLQEEILAGVDYCDVGSESINGLASDGVRVLVSSSWYCEELKGAVWGGASVQVFERDPGGQWIEAGERRDVRGELAAFNNRYYALGASLWVYGSDDPLDPGFEWLARFAGYERSMAAGESVVVVGAGEAGLYVLQPWRPLELYLPVSARLNFFRCTYPWRC